ncbi:hypothetical protein BGW37DRAFT_465806 [Umbelopsis sp. PMI_123]|nr:hypothetical protein BGW37DRAFT_465806 [Umbelopsis sp. PMI_123]
MERTYQKSVFAVDKSEMGGFIAPVFVGPLLFTALGFLIRMMCKLYITQLCRKYGDYKMLFFYKEGWWTLLIMLITEGHLHKDIKNDIWVWCVVIINTMVSQAAILFVIFTPAVPFQSPPHYSGPDFVLFPKQGDGLGTLAELHKLCTGCFYLDHSFVNIVCATSIIGDKHNSTRTDLVRNKLYFSTTNDADEVYITLNDNVLGFE